jgi:hypothetical protein
MPLDGCECRSTVANADAPRSPVLSPLVRPRTCGVVWCAMQRRCASSDKLLHLQRSYNDRILQVQEENARLHQSLQRAQHASQQEEAATQARIQSVRDECERKVKKVNIYTCVFACVCCVCMYTHTHTRTRTRTIHIYRCKMTRRYFKSSSGVQL